MEPAVSILKEGGMATLEYGAKGEDVKTIQSILKREGFFTGAVRGNFLELTKAAVVAFQQSHTGPQGKSLRGDGVVGDDTWWALNNVVDSAAGEPVLEHGDKGEWVKVVQQLLKDQGFFKGAVRGNFLKLTKEAVVYFQHTHLGPNGEFLDSDGVVGPDTWWALRNPVGKPQQSNLPREIPGRADADATERPRRRARRARGRRQGGSRRRKHRRRCHQISARGKGAFWCCYFWSWVNREAFGKHSLKAKYGRVSSAFAKARLLGMARQKGDYIPIPGDAFVMATSESEMGEFKFTGTGHIGYVLRVEVSGGKAVAINTAEGNSSNRVKLGKRNLSDAAIVGFINNYGPDEQPTGWQPGLVSAADTEGTTTR